MMKRYSTILLLLIVLFFVSNARTVIPMEPSGGVFKVSCSVNGAKMKFIFDTGASTVSLSESMADYLLENDYLSKEDIIGTGKSTVADGRIVDHVEINLKDLEIGGLHLKNIRAIVIFGQDSPLLLGQSVIQSLGKISIEDNNLIIEDGIQNLSETEIDALEKLSDKYMKEENWYAAIDCIEKIDESDGLSQLGLTDLAFCYFKLSRNKSDMNKCIELCKRYLKEFGESPSESEYLNDIYYYLGSCSDQNFDYSSAVVWWQKCYDVEKDILLKNYCLSQIASDYGQLEQYDLAIKYYKRYFNEIIPALGLTKVKVRTGNFKKTKNTTLLLAEELYFYGMLYYFMNDISSCESVMKIAVKCGSELAINFCKENNIPINVATTKKDLF